MRIRGREFLLQFVNMPSMGSVGDAYDNAMAESFFATFERQVLNRRRFRTQPEAKMAPFE